MAPSSRTRNPDDWAAPIFNAVATASAMPFAVWSCWAAWRECGRRVRLLLLSEAMVTSLWECVAQAETAALRQAEDLRVQLAAVEERLQRLAITRETLTEFVGAHPSDTGMTEGDGAVAKTNRPTWLASPPKQNRHSCHRRGGSGSRWWHCCFFQCGGELGV